MRHAVGEGGQSPIFESTLACVGGLLPMMQPATQSFHRSIRWWTLFLVFSLFASGLTAIPLRPEVDLLVRVFAQQNPPTALGGWLREVQQAVDQVSDRWPFLALGTDWLAFGHIVIGLGFLGLLKDPIRNEWLVTWGFIACALVIPWAWMFGWVHGVPWGWRLIDCSFGLGGAVPLLFIRRAIDELKRVTPALS